MKSITFVAYGLPKGQPRPRAFARNMGGGKFAARVYDAGTAEGWKSEVAIAARQFIPETPLANGLRVYLRFCMPRPKSHYNAKGEVKQNAPKQFTKKPDCDNLAKAVLDALTQVGMWVDDAQIIKLSIDKLYTTGATGCSINIEEDCE